jgi:hypothetical protein
MDTSAVGLSIPEFFLTHDNPGKKNRGKRQNDYMPSNGVLGVIAVLIAFVVYKCYKYYKRRRQQRQKANEERVANDVSSTNMMVMQGLIDAPTHTTNPDDNFQLDDIASARAYE